MVRDERPAARGVRQEEEEEVRRVRDESVGKVRDTARRAAAILTTNKRATIPGT